MQVMTLIYLLNKDSKRNLKWILNEEVTFSDKIMEATKPSETSVLKTYPSLLSISIFSNFMQSRSELTSIYGRSFTVNQFSN